MSTHILNYCCFPWEKVDNFIECLRCKLQISKYPFYYGGRAMTALSLVAEKTIDKTG